MSQRNSKTLSLDVMMNNVNKFAIKKATKQSILDGIKNKTIMVPTDESVITFVNRMVNNIMKQYS